LSFNIRGEIVDATELGSTSLNNVLPAQQILGGAVAYAGHYAGEITTTVQYQLWANVLSRVEFRWDHVDGNAFGYGQTTTVSSSTYSSPMKKNDFMLALNLIYQF
jgi:exo-beta-1,3-glucanase (GH17 family)